MPRFYGLMKIKNHRILVLYFILTFVSIYDISAQTGIQSLNGTWSFQPAGSPKTTLQVPGFYVWKPSPKSTLHFPTTGNGPWKIIEDIPEATYETLLQVPASMAGKQIFLRFESVNFLADIYLNGNFIARHIGGYLPFEINITSSVHVPSNNQLTVSIKY